MGIAPEKIPIGMPKRGGLDHQLGCHSIPSKLLALIVGRLIRKENRAAGVLSPTAERSAETAETLDNLRRLRHSLERTG